MGRDRRSALARVSLTDYNGDCVYDTFVKPEEKVTDYRTWVSGVRPQDLRHAITFKAAQAKVREILEGKILVGHALHNDLESLRLAHPREEIRDTSTYPPLCGRLESGKQRSRKLADLVWEELQEIGTESFNKRFAYTN